VYGSCCWFTEISVENISTVTHAKYEEDFFNHDIG